MSDSVNLQEFVAGFLIEADEHLHSVNRNLVSVSEALKSHLAEPRAIRELFRSIHTIKGLASMVGAEPIVEITHEMESILRNADRSGGKISENALNLLLQGTRSVEERIVHISKNGIVGLAAAPESLVMSLALEAGASGSGSAVQKETTLNLPVEISKTLTASDKEQMYLAANAGKRVVLIEFRPSSEKAANGYTITSIRDFLGKKGELVKVIPQSSPKAPTGIAFLLLFITKETNATLTTDSGFDDENIQSLSVEQKTIVPEKTNVSEFHEEWVQNDSTTIRVDIKRLDEALERLSELVVTRFKLSRIAARLTEAGADTRELNSIIADHTRQLKRLRSAITDARMVSLNELLQRIPLVVRGLIKDSDKKINVSIQAGTAEVDKAVADKIFPAIIHLVRNAVDHALESSEERIKNNKPETGTLTITCDDSSGTSLLLVIKDDGRGINKKRVAEKSQKQIARNDEELLSQIVLPGLSTSEMLTHVSGRGMGMDIVKKTIDQLGGVFSLKTSEGEGTTFSLKVPVSVTIIDVLSFISKGQIFVAPVAMIDEIIEIDDNQISVAPAMNQEGLQPRLIPYRGDSIPVFALDALLRKKNHSGEFPKKALIIQRGESALAFAVDKMLGQQEVVVRPLDNKLFRQPGMSGATDLGDGLPTLVLDLATLGEEMLKHTESQL